MLMRGRTLFLLSKIDFYHPQCENLKLLFRLGACRVIYRVFFIKSRSFQLFSRPSWRMSRSGSRCGSDGVIRVGKRGGRWCWWGVAGHGCPGWGRWRGSCREERGGWVESGDGGSRERNGSFRGSILGCAWKSPGGGACGNWTPADVWRFDGAWLSPRMVWFLSGGVLQIAMMDSFVEFVDFCFVIFPPVFIQVYEFYCTYWFSCLFLIVLLLCFIFLGSVFCQWGQLLWHQKLRLHLFFV